MKIEKGMIFRCNFGDGVEIKILKANAVQVVYKIVNTNDVYSVGRTMFELWDVTEIEDGEDGD